MSIGATMPRSTIRRREATPPTTAPPAAPRTDRVTIDSTGTGESDLLAWSGGQLSLLRRGTERVADAGLGDLKGVIFVAPGDFDNDGLMDLCVLTEAGPQLFRNTKGRFAPVEAPLPQGGVSSAPSGSTTITTTIST